MKIFKKGFIVTQTSIIILTLLSIVITSPYLTTDSKDSIKAQLLNMLSQEQTISQTVEQPTEQGVPTQTIEPSESSNITEEENTTSQTNSERYYSSLVSGVNGVFSNGIKYNTGIELPYGDWNYSGDTVVFDNNYSIPLLWLIEKDYVPISLLDIPREKKVYDCEHGLYLNSVGLLKWNDDRVKGNCETFLTLTVDQQFQFNTDFKLDRGYNYF